MSRALKGSAALAALVFACLLLALPARAEIFTEESGGGPADSVYVAGNPDLYPIEYFDPDSGSYKGLIPDILSAVSDETGISFTYISAGSRNRQKSLYENGQVELVTAIAANDEDFEAMQKLVVLTAEHDGETIEYCIGFTDVIPKAKKSAIREALSEISDTRKSGWLIDNAQTDLAASQQRFMLIIISAAAVLLIVAAIVTIVIIRKKRARNRINRMIDEKTGIGNADYYVYAFENLISEQARNLYSLVYISFDTASFEERKGSFSAGDIEKLAASKLSRYLSASEYLSRLDSGVFVLLLQAESEAAAENRIGELVEGVNKYVAELASGCGEPFRAGYCRLCDNAGIDSEGAVYNARQGYLYAATHDLPFYIGTKEQIAANRKAANLASQLDSALANNEFRLYVQFFVDSKTGRFCGGEILTRWQNREYGLLRPDEYIDILSRTGKIVEYDYRIFSEVCAILEKWSKPPFDGLFLSCNFTRLSVSNPDFAQRLAEISEKYSFERSRLVVEITENSLSTSSETVSENIRQLTQLGFRVAIDDMGAGFSSLADIYDNEIDIVKIERDFVVSCVTERRRQMMRSIILLVHNAGAKVICEGVETAEQLEMLRALGCDMTQGFYNSRVLPLPEGERFFLTSCK